MDNNSIEPKLLALDAVVTALILTHPEPQKVFTKFSQIFPEKIRSLNNKKTPEHSQITKELMSECNRFAKLFPKA